MHQCTPGAHNILKYLGHNTEIVNRCDTPQDKTPGDLHSGVVENAVLLGYDCRVTGQSVLDVPKVHSAFIFKGVGSDKRQELITV